MLLTVLAVLMIIQQLHWAAICSYIMVIVVWVRRIDLLVRSPPSSICQVPVDQTTIKTLYVFVEIAIDSHHLAQTIRMNFPNDRETFHCTLLDSEEASARIPIGSQIGVGRNLRILETSDESKESTLLKDDVAPSTPHPPTKLALVSTIQFVAALQRLKEDLSMTSSGENSPPVNLLRNEASPDVIGDPPESTRSAFWTGKYEAIIPRSKPLSPGEILGCTAPRVEDVDALM